MKRKVEANPKTKGHAQKTENLHKKSGAREAGLKGKNKTKSPTAEIQRNRYARISQTMRAINAKRTIARVAVFSVNRRHAAMYFCAIMQEHGFGKVVCFQCWSTEIQIYGLPTDGLRGGTRDALEMRKCEPKLCHTIHHSLEKETFVTLSVHICIYIYIYIYILC